MSDNWYIVDTLGQTQGPMDETELIKLYLNENIHSKTYIWNGETVKEWLPIMHVKHIYDKIKHHYIHQHKFDTCIQNQVPTPKIEETAEKIVSGTSEQICNDQIPTNEITVDDASTSEYFADDLIQQNDDEHKQVNEEQIESKIEQKEDTDIHTNSTPNYPSTLHFLKRNSDRLGLMANIRNGINLRNQLTTNAKQNKSNVAPKRLKDKFKQTSTELISNPEQQFTDQTNERNENANDENVLSLSTPIDQDLIMDVQKNGYYNRNNKRKYFQSMNKASINNIQHRTVYSNEIAARASNIRKRFGEVQIVSGKGKKNDSFSGNKNVEDTQNPLRTSVTLKSSQFANRIAKLKHKLDQLTDNESWIVTRIENVFLSSNK